MLDRNLDILLIFPDPEPLWRGAAQTAARRLPRHKLHFAYTLDDAASYVADADVIVSFAFREDFARRAARLKWIHGLGAGVDRILGVTGLAKEVILTNTRGIHADPVSEAALGMMFALSRDFRRAVLDQRAKRWLPWDSLLLKGKTVGVYGIGAISEALGKKCQALGMRTVGITKRTDAVPGFDEMYSPARRNSALGMADYVVLLAPLMSDNVGVVDRDFLAAMKPAAFLINVARGPLVNNAELIVALREGRIGGAALDANDPEPLPPESPLWEMDNVLITPHIAGRFPEYLDRSLDIFEENLACFIRADYGRMVNRVDRATGMVGNPWHAVRQGAK